MIQFLEQQEAYQFFVFSSKISPKVQGLSNFSQQIYQIQFQQLKVLALEFQQEQQASFIFQDFSFFTTQSVSYIKKLAPQVLKLFEPQFTLTISFFSMTI